MPYKYFRKIYYYNTNVNADSDVSKPCYCSYVNVVTIAAVVDLSIHVANPFCVSLKPKYLKGSFFQT